MARPLKIPLFFQPGDKPYCGPACLKMALAFYGQKHTLKELVSNLPMTITGIDMCAMGLLLLRMGFSPLIYINAANAKNLCTERQFPSLLVMEARSLFGL